jgi:hypothetical protein
MSPKILTEDVIVRVFREEFERRQRLITEELKMTLKIDGEMVPVISKGLKITKDSDDNEFGKKGQLYTVEEVGTSGVLLKYVDDTGEEKIVRVDSDRLEYEFTL